MKHLIYIKQLIVALAVSVLLLSGCSKDDDTPSVDSSKFVGDWLVTGIYKDGKNIMPSTPVLGKGSESYITLTSDGAFGANLDVSYGGEEWTTWYIGTWKLVSNNLIKVNGEDELKVMKITETQLDFEFEDEDIGMLEVRSVRD